MPVEFHLFGFRIWTIFLDAVADISEDFGFGGVIDFGMVFNLIDSSKTEVS